MNVQINPLRSPCRVGHSDRKQKRRQRFCFTLVVAPSPCSSLCVAPQEREPFYSTFSLLLRGLVPLGVFPSTRANLFIPPFMLLRGLVPLLVLPRKNANFSNPLFNSCSVALFLFVYCPARKASFFIRLFHCCSAALFLFACCPAKNGNKDSTAFILTISALGLLPLLVLLPLSCFHLFHVDQDQRTTRRNSTQAILLVSSYLCA